MAWETLKTDYTDAIWTGNRKYKQTLNDDETVSFEDVTEYSQKENSFFGANDANSINEAVNYIMKALENDTDLYEDFKNYFDNQKTAFTTTGDNMMRDLQDGYQTAMENYRETQDANFTAWVETLKTKLDDADVAKLQGEIEDLTESSKVTLSDSGSTTDYAKIYTISQGGTGIGKINIPKDLVVESGSVVKNPTSALTGTYIKLVIANQTEPIYINVADLCDAYTGGSTSTVNVSISDTNKVTATLVSGSISKSLLSSDVQSTLNQVATNTANIATNTSAISTIKSDLGAYPVKYTETTTAPSSGSLLSNIVGYLKKQVTSLLSTVSSHTSSISSLNSTVSSHTSSISSKASKNWTWLAGTSNGATYTYTNAEHRSYSEYMICATINNRVLATTIITGGLLRQTVADATNGFHQTDYKNGTCGGGLSYMSSAGTFKVYSWGTNGYTNIYGR